MRVGRKIALVGGVPILVAAAIAAAGWFLIAQADRARGGALLAARIYHDLTLARMVRDDYLGTRPDQREAQAARFLGLTEAAGRSLNILADRDRSEDRDGRAASARQALALSLERMRDLTAVTRENDDLIAEMERRAARLTDLAEQARQRQQTANAALAWTLAAKANRLRSTREAVMELHALLAAEGRLALAQAQAETQAETAPSADTRALVQAGRALATALRATSRDAEAAELDGIIGGSAIDRTVGKRLRPWGERLLVGVTAEQRGLDEEVAQRLTDAVEANAAEQATQNIGIATLKLGQRTSEALARRDAETIAGLLQEGERLSGSAAALPIAPPIRSEMVEAIDGWRERLAAALDGLKRQTALLAEMDRLAATMSEAARTLNDEAVAEADRAGIVLGRLLLAGAAFGLLLGAWAALAVARSILVPLRRLQSDMIALAADPKGAGLSGTQRTDELGDIARATNFFVTEIGRRERALRRAKDQADAALQELRRTQDDLIRAEKLASLGQLVAGVAHEINTPLGIALTTATLVRDETGAFQTMIAAGTLSRSRLNHFVNRLGEGTHLLCSNLTRAADLVHGFKQVAADRASDERRSVQLATWLDELLASLQPILRKGGHRVERHCPPDLVAETYPGVLAQIVTNLITNAVAHGFAGTERPGTITIRVTQTGAAIRLEVIDDGDGIARENLGRIFDPFFTTARARGSTGLGMQIVHNLVTGQLQGRIAVESEPGRGTLVRLEFPRELAADRTGAAQRPAAAEIRG